MKAEVENFVNDHATYGFSAVAIVRFTAPPFVL